MSQWFRMYAEVLNDPKAQRLKDADFRGWVNVLCLACQNDGVIPSDDDIAFALRIEGRKAAKLMETLAAARLIDVSETGRTPHNWSGRQYKSDVSTDRVKRFRNAKRNVSSAVTETPPETDTETEQSSVSKETAGDAVDPSKIMFDAGVSLITSSGKTEQAARSWLGKARSRHGEEAVITMIGRAKREGAIDPISFMEGGLKSFSSKQPVIPL